MIPDPHTKANSSETDAERLTQELELELIHKRSGDEAEELWKRHLQESAKVVLGDRASATVVELLS